MSKSGSGNSLIKKSIKGFPTPLPYHESEIVKKRQRRQASTYSTRRVLAPVVKAPRKPKAKIAENKYFSCTQKTPKVLMNDMSKLLFEGVDVVSVLTETGNVLKEATNATDINVYMVDDAKDEIYPVSHKVKNFRITYKIGTGTTVAAHVAFLKDFIKINDLLEDERFPEGLGSSEVTVKGVICVPILTPDKDCLAIFELYRELDDISFDDRDLRLVIVMSGWIGSTIYQHQQRITLQKQQELNEYLLDLTKCYFADTMLLDKLITEVVNFAKISLNAEHGLFFVMKPKHRELYADYYEEGIGADKDVLFKKNVQMKLGQEDLVSIVARKGVTINIRNAYKDRRIPQDKKKGYIIRSVLCMPIKGIDEIMGVIQILNKKKGACFTKSDEVLFQTFSVYCAFVLSYTRLYNKMTYMNNMNEVFKQMLAHHMQPCIHDYNFTINHPDVTLPPRFNQFDFYISDAYECYMPQLTMYMFNEIAKDAFIDLESLVRFVLIISKSYQENPYHNLFHAFNVCHSMYNICKRNSDHFTHIENKALIISSFCHDVGHYGVTNNFLEITNHYLAQLYEESILENHHVHVTLMVIENMKLFSQMTKEDYKTLISEIRLIILATDLSAYFKRRGKLYQICVDNAFDWEDTSHRNLLKSIVMTMTDLSGMCKPFSIAKHIIDHLYREFYREGDREKQMGLCPLSIMDREKSQLVPSDQVQFMTVVVLPCALILTKLLPNCAPLYKEALKLRETWLEIDASQGQKLWSAEDSVEKKNR